MSSSKARKRLRAQRQDLHRRLDAMKPLDWREMFPDLAVGNYYPHPVPDVHVGASPELIDFLAGQKEMPPEIRQATFKDLPSLYCEADSGLGPGTSETELHNCDPGPASCGE